MATGKNYNALIVDDNWYNRDIFQIALESAGYRVTHADSGPKGIKILETKTFHVVLLDLQMPEVDGITVLRAIRANPLHENTRVVVVTANAHMATSEVEQLSDHVMFKPINVMDFAQFVSRLRYTSPIYKYRSQSDARK